ncbi:MAG TPA: histone deacetylase [Candidatus Limnocylindria bacterium]|jgi:acetoin utilization deacetylase AcuC-like enzyme
MTAVPTVLLLTDELMRGDAHAGHGHPERPERLPPVVDGVVRGADEAGARLERPSVTAATDEEIQRIHPAWFLAELDTAAARGGGWIDADTYLRPQSMQVSRLAAGATLAAATAAVRGTAAVAFAAVRPPGHHAFEDATHGFCLLNNVAIAVAGLRADGLAQRIAIVDWDVHHGDGTQAIFEADPDLCYASTHQWPFYPGTGRAEERGTGPAAGTKHNVPLPAGSGDRAFSEAWTVQLLPAIEAFGPEAILVSAGYDAHRRDPLASLEVTEDGYELVATALGQLAARLGHRGVGLTLEGGYDPEGLAGSSAATVRGLVAGLSQRA